MKNLLAISLSLMVFLAAQPSIGEDVSPQEQLKIWGEEFAATWVSESTLDADVEGLGKEGDTIVIQGTVTPLNGVYQIVWETSINGKATTTGVAVAGWDASKKKVKAQFFSGLGQSSTVLYSKRGDKWVVKTTSIEPDGTKGSETALVTVSDKAHTYQFTDRKLGEEALPDKKIVWTRK